MLAFTKWMWRGAFNYTRSAYEKKSSRFVPEHLTSINYPDTNFVVTGANSGIGYATALDLARRGGRVHMICRNKERGEQALFNIIQETGSENMIDEGERIDVLILNAGVMMSHRTTTDEGHEMTFATNLLGPYLRTPEQGADTIVWLAVSPTVENESGGFYEDRELTAKHLTKDTESTREEIDNLWTYLEKCVQDEEQQPKEQQPNSRDNSDNEHPDGLVEGETHPMR
ncbi:hypothetical protein PPL_10273 [Heterostelium album PN500]|uniref:Uncharacterized protein n=1 Tax=Heterostelium pallidum (strain ATCC 26659 / Pp 5 / PN500) TaxID=670386 RepID=D3BQT5_HETP5|nr:hypothetical protein PPL_10273 [Heterostelium album PN500]EFA76505.1 hypothetical protein PPL_10273 [Heterostelium album PN500]|eukprot:XP_020428637.1 hypothetical protein PPL_10273 [Heterostelium album PN500]